MIFTCYITVIEKVYFNDIKENNLPGSTIAHLSQISIETGTRMEHTNLFQTFR